MRTGRGAGIYIEEGRGDGFLLPQEWLRQRQDARYPFSANLPDRYLWMTLDSSV